METMELDQEYVKRLESENNQLRKELMRAEISRDSIRKELKSRTVILQSIKEELSFANKNLVNMSLDNEKLRIELSELNSQWNRLDEQYSELNIKYTTLTTELDINKPKEKKYEPFTEPDFIWIGCKVRCKEGINYGNIYAISNTHIFYNSGVRQEETFDYMFKKYDISYDNGETWQPFGKEVE